MIPILESHDPSVAKVIGQCTTTEDGRIEITMADGRELTQAQLWATFGSFQVSITKMIRDTEDSEIIKIKTFVLHAFVRCELEDAIKSLFGKV